MRQSFRFSSLIPHGLVVESVVRGEDTIFVTAGASACRARCPLCHASSQRVHSRYPRQVSDLPCAGRSVRLRVITRRFRCDEPSCRRRIFAERFEGDILPARSRRTARLEGIVHHLGLALGGRPGASLAVYKGTPDELFRKKVRTALGFVLGVYLVETGHTSYDSHWRFVGGTARSAYSLGGRAFDLAPMPLAHLSDRNFQHDLGPEKTVRMVGALFASFGTLDLGNLSWAYWHARCATVHIAPAQYGAAIEGLLRAFEKHQAGRGRTTILDRAAWVRVSRAIAMTIAAADTAESAKLAMGKNLARLNEPAKRVALADALQTMGIDIGPDEAKAWRRRNLAAHGMPIEEGQELAAIRDMKLLKGLFHRMLLSASKAAETYIDYASPFFPIRPLKDPPHTSHGI